MKKLFILFIFIFSFTFLIGCTVEVPGGEEVPEDIQSEPTPDDGNRYDMYLEDSENFRVIPNRDYYAFRPIYTNTGIIFIAKNDVEVLAYGPLMRTLAEEGYLSVLIRNQEELSVTINTIITNYKNIDSWYIGGHSSGGILASNFLEEHHSKFDGLFLLASYSNVDLSHKGLKILTMYGDSDTVLNLRTYKSKLENLGEYCIEYVIEGGNHSMFADCDLSENDNPGIISLFEQIEITANKIKELINSPDIEIEDPTPVLPPITAVKHEFTYTESNETISNPDQGFYTPYFVATSTNYVAEIPQQMLYRNALIHLRIDLSAFSYKTNRKKDIELSKEMLAGLERLFKQVDDAEACAIVRFAYDKFEGNSDLEPNISMIETHISQFSTVINKYKNCITALECGLIGPWGEMHSSNLAEQTAFNKVFKKYLSCLDKDVKLLVRRPEMIYKYYGFDIDELNKFDYENNRIGVYNDGYLGSKSDLGTFEDRTVEVAFLEKINQNFPYGGEVTTPTSKYNQLSWACEEMFRTNLTYLNIQWNDEVVARWQNTNYTLTDPLYKGKTEFDYINNHMGYRFVCESAEISIADYFYFQLNMKNVGFGECFKTKNAYLILKNNDTQIVKQFVYKNSLIINYHFDISTLSPGSYDVYFVLAEKFTDHAIRGIRFANTNMYNEELNANKIGTITI